MCVNSRDQVWLGSQVAEEVESPEAGGESTAGADPAAMALGLASASRNEADAFLRNQNSLIDLQKHHLHEQFKNLHLSIWEKQLGVLLRLATLCVGVAVAGFVAVAVWDAMHDD